MNILHSQQSQIPSESDVLTPEEINELNNMQRGDSSNKKGALYEKNFTIYQMLRYTKQVLDQVKSFKIRIISFFQIVKELL